MLNISTRLHDVIYTSTNNKSIGATNFLDSFFESKKNERFIANAKRKIGGGMESWLSGG